MVLGNSLIFFLYKLGWMGFRQSRDRSCFQTCTSAELSLSTIRFNHVYYFFRMECAPVRQAC